MSGLFNTLPFDLISRFNLSDPTKLEISAAKGQLKLVADPGKTWTQDFASSTGFTYDAAKAEFSAGKLQQKSQRPANATFGVTYTLNQHAVWGDSFLNGTLRASANVSAGVLHITTSTDCVEYYSPDNAKLGQIGTVRFRFKPDWSGMPPASRYMFSYGGLASPFKNKIDIYQTGTGFIYLVIKNNAGVDIVNQNCGSWNPTAGTWYEFCLCFNVTAGATRFFIGGTQLGATSTATGTRDYTDCVLVIVGNSINELYAALGDYNDVVFYSTSLFSANYTPGYTLPESVYLETKVDLPNFVYSGLGTVAAYTGITDTESGSPRMIVNGKYYSGGWISSDGSYAQASPIATVLANLATLTGTTPTSVSVVFQTGATQGYIDQLDITYSGQIYPTDNPYFETAASFELDELLGFVAVLSEIGGDKVKIALNISGTPKYHNGSAWVTSSGYAQTNTPAEIDAAASQLNISSGANLKVRVYLHSDTGATTPTITSHTTEYDFFASEPTAPNECVIYGWLTDLLGNGVVLDGSTTYLEIENLTTFVNADHLILPCKKRISSNIEGYIEKSAVETATVGHTYKMRIIYVDIDGEEQTVELGATSIPDQTSENISDLTFV